MSKKVSTMAVLSLFFMPVFLAAQTPPDPAVSDLSFSLGLDAGVISGLSQEIVYYLPVPSSPLPRKVLSRLDWEEKALAFTVSPKLEYKNLILLFNLMAALPGSVTAGIPGFVTTLEDRDWQDRVYYNMSSSNLNNYYDQTNFSSHDLLLSHHFDLAAAGSYVFRPGILRIEPGAGIQFRTRGWKGTDGYKQYDETPPYNTAAIKPDPMYGAVINYYQSFWMPFIALDLAVALGDLFEIGLGGRLYPAIWMESIDEHVVTLTDYKDNVTDAFGGKVALSFTYRPAGAEPAADPRWAFTFRVAYETFAADSGASYLKSHSNSSYIKISGSGPGVAVDDLSVFLGATYRVF
jgi:outer membrane protease